MQNIGQVLAEVKRDMLKSNDVDKAIITLTDQHDMTMEDAVILIQGWLEERVELLEAMKAGGASYVC